MYFSPRQEGRLITSGTGHIKFWKMAQTVRQYAIFRSYMYLVYWIKTSRRIGQIWKSRT